MKFGLTISFKMLCTSIHQISNTGISFSEDCSSSSILQSNIIPTFLGDGHCDDSLNIVECEFDLGDCCLFTLLSQCCCVQCDCLEGLETTTKSNDPLIISYFNGTHNVSVVHFLEDLIGIFTTTEKLTTTLASTSASTVSVSLNSSIQKIDMTMINPDQLFKRFDEIKYQGRSSAANLHLKTENITIFFLLLSEICKRLKCNCF